MKSASEMSAMIRAKKKKMKEDPDVIDSGGSPSMDLQDLDIARREEATDALNQNKPTPHSDGENLSPEEDMDEEKSMRRKNRAKQMLMPK